MSAREAGRELDALIAEIMEPKPAPISARALRATYRNWVWYSCFEHESPAGWWWAEIGTDHGDDDDKDVTWRPMLEPSTDISAAWRVVEKIRDSKDDGLRVRFSREVLGLNLIALRAEQVAEALCLAALAAVEAER